MAANIEYVEKAFSRCLFLKEPFPNFNPAWYRAVNAEFVLKRADYYNYNYAKFGTVYGQSEFATKQLANKQFVDYAAANVLRSINIVDGIGIRGDTWNNTAASYIDHIPISMACIASLSFKFYKYGTPTLQTLARVGVRNLSTNETIIFFGSGAGGDLWEDIAAGENKLDIALEPNYEFFAVVMGNYDSQSYGVISDLNVKAKLKINEIFVPTPLTINTLVNYSNAVKEFPITVSANYSYSFFAYNGTQNGGYTNEKIIKFSLINAAGAETVIYNPEQVTNKSYKDYITGNIAATAGGKFRAECSIAANNKDHGVIECLTIKGTI
jgi:hypothetical protein